MTVQIALPAPLDPITHMKNHDLNAGSNSVSCHHAHESLLSGKPIDIAAGANLSQTVLEIANP
jgi:hypothetical protein